MFLYIKILMYS